MEDCFLILWTVLLVWTLWNSWSFLQEEQVPILVVIKIEYSRFAMEGSFIAKERQIIRKELDYYIKGNQLRGCLWHHKRPLFSLKNIFFFHSVFLTNQERNSCQKYFSAFILSNRYPLCKEEMILLINVLLQVITFILSYFICFKNKKFTFQHKKCS